MEIVNKKRKERFLVTALLICGMLFSKLAISADLPIQTEKQKTDVWCWAAAATAFLNRYFMYPGKDIDTGYDGYGQCVLASRLFDFGLVIDCCKWWIEPVCITGATSSELQKVLNDPPYSMNISLGGWLTDREIEIHINDRKSPFIMDVIQPSGNHHSLVAVALSSDKTVLTAMDPSNGEYIKATISSWKSGNNPHGYKWDKTLYWSPAGSAPIPQANVKIRHTELSSSVEYAYTSSGVMETTDTVVKSGARVKLISGGAGKPVTLNTGTTFEPGAKMCVSNAWCSW